MSRPLPGGRVLIDTHCCSRCARELFTRGDRGTVRRIIPSGQVQVDVDRTGKTVLFNTRDVPPVPAEPRYPCCHHMYGGCPSPCRGHNTPCTKCGQFEQDSADRQAARAMNQQTAS